MQQQSLQGESNYWKKDEDNDKNEKEKRQKKEGGVQQLILKNKDRIIEYMR